MAETLETSDEWETCYSELHRRVDHQIKDNERFETHAMSLLRISLTSIGVFLTGVSVGFSTGYISWPSVDLNALSQVSEEVVVSLPILNTAQSTLVTIILFGIITATLLRSVHRLFYVVPISAYSVLEPSVYKPASESDVTVSAFKSDLSDNTFYEKIITEYQDAIEENKQALSTTRENWESCHSALKQGIVSLGVAISVFIVTVILQNTLMTVFILLGIVLQTGRYFTREDVQEDLSQLLFLDREIDIATGIFIVLVFISYRQTPFELPNDGGPKNIAVSLFSLFIFGIALVAMYRISDERALNILERNLVISVGLFTILFFMEIGTAETINAYSNYILVPSFMSVIGATFSFGVVLAIIRIGKSIVSKTKDRVTTYPP